MHCPPATEQPKSRTLTEPTYGHHARVVHPSVQRRGFGQQSWKFSSFGPLPSAIARTPGHHREAAGLGSLNLQERRCRGTTQPWRDTEIILAEKTCPGS